MTFNRTRSLCNKTIGVPELLNENMWDACLITEAWLKVKDTGIVAEIRDMGYDIKVQPRKGNHGGGCVVYKNALIYKNAIAALISLLKF